MYNTRETIHVSLGSTANAVTAHLLNLEGLAATTTSGNDEADPWCDPYVTHTVSRRENKNNPLYVPRVLMVDERHNYFVRQHQAQHQAPPSTAAAAQVVPTWDGSVQEVREDKQDNINNDDTTSRLHEAASVLANSTYSRYRVPPAVQQQYSTQHISSTSSNGRHMQWDDADEEEEEEEDEQDKIRRQARQRREWYVDTKEPLEQQMDQCWQKLQQQDSSSEETKELLSWMDYWMPPYPSWRSYAAPLPFFASTAVATGGGGGGGIVESWDSYSQGASEMKLWKEDVLLEKLRRLLEECDAIQGLTILTEGWGVYAGLTTCLLQEVQEECRTAGRFAIQMTEPYNNNNNRPNNLDDSSSLWQLANVQRVRRNLQSGLALHGLATQSHVMLPLSFPDQRHDTTAASSSDTLFAKSATVAMNLEAATLSYRLSGKKLSKIAINSGYFAGSDGDGGIANHLSFGEFVACLRPSSQHSILELDTALGVNRHDGEEASRPPSFLQHLQVGTSIERARLLQQGGRDAQIRRPRDVLPGGWMLDCNIGGILTSFSPARSKAEEADRRLHRHFALSTSLRPSTDTKTATSIDHYVTSLTEGMGIRYRPEVAMGTVVGQSITSLTAGGYGAGSYWKYILGGEQTPPPVLSVLGNTTRVYPYLNSTATNMKQALSRKYRGYYNRDVASGILPDAEDCSEALEYCLNLSDAYQPPEGSGLVADSEGIYFDSNTE